MPVQQEHGEELIAHLRSKGLVPNSEWVSSFLSAERPAMPLAALKQSALFRILASDFRQTLQPLPSTLFPEDVLDATIKERRITGSIPVQVVNMEDMSRSLWSQIEEIEAKERGEMTKGREIIRVLPSDEATSSSTEETSSKSGPYKLALQDAAGMTVYGIEIVPLPALSNKMNIGAKLILKNATVARGVILLDPTSTIVLGGKIDVLDKTWKQNRKESLKLALTDLQT